MTRPQFRFQKAFPTSRISKKTENGQKQQVTKKVGSKKKMTFTHLHLIATHLPIFGSLLGAIVLAYGLISKSRQTQQAAYLVFILSALGAGAAYASGEAAEETVETIAGISEYTVEQHEEFAIVALVSMLILGGLAVLSFIRDMKPRGASRKVAIIMLALAVTSFGLAARTGYLGGQIRHTEIQAQQNSPNQPLQQFHDTEFDDD